MATSDEKQFWREWELVAHRWFGIAALLAFLFWKWWLILLTVAIFVPFVVAVCLGIRIQKLARERAVGEVVPNAAENTNAVDRRWMLQ